MRCSISWHSALRMGHVATTRRNNTNFANWIGGSTVTPARSLNSFIYFFLRQRTIWMYAPWIMILWLLSSAVSSASISGQRRIKRRLSLERKVDKEHIRPFIHSIKWIVVRVLTDWLNCVTTASTRLELWLVIVGSLNNDNVVGTTRYNFIK